MSVLDAIQPTLTNEIVSAVQHVLGVSSASIPLHEPEFAGREWQYVKDCIDSGWVSSVGSYVDRFERELAAFTGAASAVATSNGTAALHTCLLLAGVQPGEEVFVPTLTFVATANVVRYVYATPHLVDCEETTLGVDARRLEDYLRDIGQIKDGGCFNRRTGARIRALIVMHVFGHPSDLHSLVELCRRWKLVLIEDAAESLGSMYHGRHTGNFGALAALSFNGNKIVTTGGGGAILTNDEVLARKAKHLTTTARVQHRWSFVHDEVGYNYRLPNLNAALGCAQLERLPEMLSRKRQLAKRYADAFSSVAGVRFLDEPSNTSSNFWLNAIVLDKPSAACRDDLLSALNNAGYACRPAWALMHRLAMYRDCPRMDLAVAERMEASILNLPSSARLGA